MATKLNLKALLANLLACASVDDTDDFWSIRKYANGEAECWGTYTTTLSHYAIWNNFGSYHTGAIALPSGLFTSRPCVTYGVSVGDGFAVAGTNMSINENTIDLFAMTSKTGSQTTVWDIHVKGYWK